MTINELETEIDRACRDGIYRPEPMIAIAKRFAIEELERILPQGAMTVSGGKIPERHYWGLIESIKEAISDLGGQDER